MSASDWHGWLVAVRRTPKWGDGDWRDELVAAGQRLFVPLGRGFFAPDGQMWEGGTPHGRYRFVDVAEAEDAFGGAPWFRLAAPCPWVGEVVGFVDCQWWMSPEDARFDLERLLGAAKGWVARVADGATFDVIARNTYALADASQKHGFGDGDDLPELSEAYDAYVWGEIERALAAIGLAARKIDYGTSHNRIRFDQLVPARGTTHAQAWACFAQHRDDPLTLWAYNARRDELDEILSEPATPTRR